MPDPQETQQQDIGATGPSTDLSTKDFPAGTTGVDDGVPHDVSGKPLDQSTTPGQAAPKVDYKALASQMGGTPVPPKVDYHALAAQMGGTPVSPTTPQKTAPEQSHDLLTRTLGWLMTKPPKDQSLATVEAQAKENARDNTASAQAKNVSDYIYNNILGKDTYQHSNLAYDEKPTTAWGNFKQRAWGWLTQDEINKLPGLEPDRVAALQQTGNDYLGSVFGKEKADQLREHLLNGSWVVNQPPEVFARAAAKSVSDYFSPGYYALGAFGRVAQGYQKAGQVLAAAGDWTKAAQAMGKARLLGLLGTAANVPFAASQAHDLVENWDKMNVPERVAAVSGILGASINTHVGINAAGGYSKVAGDAIDATKQATSVATQATKKAVGSVASLGKAQDFNTAVERASDITKKGFAEHRAKIQNVSPDLQAILNANPTADSPQKFAKAIDDHIQSGEQALLAASGATQHDTAPVVSDLETRLDKHLDKFFADNRGKFGTQDEVDAAKEDVKNRIMQQAGKNPDGSPILRAPNLFESENVRQGLNIDAAPQYRTDAKPTTNAYKAGAFEAAKVMREAIDEAYSDRGIDNVKERRAKEAKLIDVRDRLAAAQKRAEDMGNGGLWDALIKRFSVPSIISAIALGHNPLALGALAPYLAGDNIYQNVKNPNRNVARAAKLAAPNATATELSFRPQTPGATPSAPGVPPTPGTPPVGGPTVPPPAPVAPPVAPATPVLASHPSQVNPHPQIAPEPLPAPHVLAEHAANVAPATMEEPPVNHALNAELATHFGEPLSHATLDDRVEHVKNDVEAMRKTGVALTPAQTKVLGAINEHEAAHTDAIEQTQKKSREDAYKVAEELHKMLAQEAEEEKQQKVEEAKKAKTVEPQEGLKTKQAAASPAFEYTDEEIPVPKRYSYVNPRNTRIHEIGHIIASHVGGFPALDVISHLHPDADPHALAEARSDINSLRGEDGEINASKVADKLSELTVRALAGGMAEEIYGDVPFEVNKTTAGDLRGIRGILSDYMSKGDADRFIDMHKARTKKLLTSEGMSDIFEKYGAKRIAGTHQNYHLNPANTAQMVEELGEKSGRQTQGNDRQAILERTPNTVGQNDTGREGTVRGEGSSDGIEVSRVSSTKTQQRATGLVEKSTGDHDIDAVIRNGGGIPAGHMDMGEFGKIHMFHDPETGSTLGFKPSEKITPQNVGKKLAKSREDFAQGEENNRKRQEAEEALATTVHLTSKPTDMQAELAKTREQSRADRRHELSVDTEKAFNTKQEEKKPGAIEIADENTGGTTERLLAKHGESTDPLANGFILSDGRRIAMGATDHADAVRQVTPKNERSPNMQEDMVDYLNRENVVRTRYRDSYGGKEVVFSVPKDGVSEEQVSQMRQSVGKMGRNGNVVMETADSNGKSTQKEFALPSHIDSMLREIGAHPEQKGEAFAKGEDANHQAEELATKQKADAKDQKIVDGAEWENLDDESDVPSQMSLNRRLVIKDTNGEDEIGHVEIEDGNRIVSTGISPEYRNRGIGKAMYERVIEDARSNGEKILRSGATVSSAARNVWESLIRDGKYDIVKKIKKGFNPNGGGITYTVNLGKEGLSTKQAGEKSVSVKGESELATKQSDVANAANEFNKENGRDEIVPGTTHNPELAKRIADAYDKMPHNPNDPAVEKSYDSLKKDIDDQWDYARDKMGIKFEPWKKEGQPYANSKEMVADVKNNKHLYFFQGGELPEDHPLTEQAGEGLSYNDKLRAVHDLFGHAAHDYQFGPKGEENAWNVHRQMFSPESIPAVTTETRGQNSWVNYGQYLRVPFKEGQTVPKERTTGKAVLDAAIKQGGAIPGGFEKGDADANVPDMAHFHDPTTGSTLVLAADRVTPEAVKQELAKSRQTYLTAKPNESRIPEKGQPGYVPPTERPYAQNKAGLLPEEFHRPNWAEKVTEKPFGGVNPNNPEAPSKKYGFEIAPELRHNPESLTADEAKAYSERPDVKAALAAHPDIKLGWDTTTQGPELNIGASTDDLETAKKIAGKLDQRAIVNTSTGEEIPVGGEGKRTEFSNYSLSNRLRDLEQSNASKKYEVPDFESFKKSFEGDITDADKKSFNFWKKYYDNNPPSTVYRVVGVDSPNDVNLKKPGFFWSTDPESAMHAADVTGDIWEKGTPHIITAKISPQDVDWPETLRANVLFGAGESEINLHKNAKPAVQDIKNYEDFSKESPKGSKQKDEDFNFGKNEGTEDQQKGIISTAVPGGKNAIADPHTENVHVGMQSLTPETKVKIADKIRKMPGMRTPENITDPDKVIGRYINQFKDNLKDLYNRVPPETRDQTAKWYESANKIADKFASKYGKSTKQGAGVLAAMSPQKDWNMNVGLAERLTDIYHTKNNESLSPEARVKAREIGLGGMAAAIGDKTFSQLTEPLEKAAFIRIWDEAHNDRSFQNVDPGTGEYTHVMKNNDGSNSKIAWGALNEIAKAVNILDDGSRENISRNLGMAHKVRNFYNNIVDPNNPGGHVTIDTHAVAAGHQRPLSGFDPEVLDNFGRISALKTGLKGTYAVNAEAYRRAAQELGLQPRQLQSIVWEQIRKDFPAELKTNETHRAAIDDIWSRYKDGKITQKEAQEQTREYAKTAREQIEANAEKPSTQQDLFPVLPSKFVNFKTQQNQSFIPPQAVWDNLGPKTAPGMIQRGNLPLNNRPIIKNDDGTHSSEFSVTMEDEKSRSVLLPTIVDGKFLTPDGKKPPTGHHEKQADGSDKYIATPEEKAMFKLAYEHYKKTGQHLGIFDTWQNADKAADAIHSRKQPNLRLESGLDKLGGK